jgi:O-antigen ligase
MIGQDRSDVTIHNTYLAIWVEMGLFGLAAFVWLFLAGGTSAFSALRRTMDPYASVAISGLLGALTVIALHMTVATFTDRRLQFLWFILGLIAVTARLSCRTQVSEAPASQPVQTSKLRPTLSLAPQAPDASD